MARRSVAPATVATMTALSIALAIALAGICLALVFTGRRRGTALALLADRLERIAGPVPAHPRDRLAAAVAQVEARWAEQAPRQEQRHRVTDLPTREPLLARMAGDGAGLLGTLAFLDYDQLASTNPAEGDEALLLLADRLTRMVSGRRLIAQVDRAHFAIWFGADVPVAEAHAQFDAITYALADALPLAGRTVLPEIRHNQAVYPAEGATPSLMLARSLSALALGRRSLGPMPSTVADTVDAARERYAMEQDLRHAIDRQEFALQYQPLVDARAGAVCGAEALVRWDSPGRGRVPPARFVPLVEAIGLADELGMWTLNAATRAAAAWREAGLADLRVAVNVSAHQLARADMRQLVERTLARHTLDPRALEIELTESAAAADTPRAAELFAALRSLGVGVAIDDFGTGFSSFSTLRALAFDKIKIDREFVTAVDSRRDSQAICESILALGRGLGIRVLAEGVERAEEYGWLRDRGCRYFQGYYFAAPLDDAAFRAFSADHAGLARRLAIEIPVAAPTRRAA